MTPEVVLIAAVRVLGSLPVLRWPLAGALLAVLIDLSDLLLRDVLGQLPLGGMPDYQGFDKWADQVYLGLFLVVALRWRGVERIVSVILYGYRLVGFVAFELTGTRELLLLFPNLFEVWFIAVAAVHRFRPEFRWSRATAVVALGGLFALKEAQEWALHGARLFDGISSLEFLDRAGRWLRGS